MRSLKLLVAMAVLSAFVAGPVLAQSSPAMSDTTSGSSMKPSCPKGQHYSKKQSKCVVSKHRKSSSTAAPMTTTGQ
jgi:hypothetical protein